MTEVVSRKPATRAYKYLQRMHARVEMAKEKACATLNKAELWDGAIKWQIDQRVIDLNTAWVKEASRYWGSVEIEAAVKQLGMSVRPSGYLG